MTTYDNLNIAQATLIFDENGSTAVGAGEFDLSSMAFLPNVPLIDQIEVERVFDTGADTKFGENIFTIADRRQMFIFPKNWYTINEQTKILKFVDLNTIPIGTDQAVPVYYPLSRGYFLVLDNGNTNYITIPVVQNTTTSGPPVRQYDKVFIRRKTPSINSIVTFAPGTRLTTTQLNLQFDQLKYLVQEIVAKIRNEVILKYDENAVDGPFLGNGDLKMNNNFIKDVGSKEITDTATFFTGQDNIAYSGGTFTANVLSVKNAVTKGSLYRTGLVAGTPTFTGDFTTRLPGVATDYKITNLSPGTAATDAVNLSQLNDANNLTTGTVHVDRLPANIPLAKLSSAVGQVYTLPLENLPSTLGTAVGTFGQSSASNTNNMVYATVNAKGVLSSLGHRNMTVDDLPVISGLVAQAYGGTGKLLTVTPDTKGRITSISSASIVNADLPTSGVSLGTYGSDNATNALAKFTVDNKGIITSASHRSITVADLPTTSVTNASTYGQSTATNTNNMLQIAYDTTGRVTLASHRSMGHADLPANIPLSKLSDALSQSYILPKDAIADGSILFAKLDTVTANQSALPLNFIPNGIILSKINPATPGAFILPDSCLNDTAVAPGTYSASPIKDIVVDAKGRITSISQRAIVSGDIPALSASAISITTSAFADALIPPLAVSSAGSYGSVNNIPTFTVDTKGRVTVAASSAAISTGHISDFNTNTNTLIDARAISLAGGAFYNANNKLISNVLNPVTDQDATTKKWIVDNYQSLSGFNAAALTQIQANAVFWDSANSRFTALRSSVAQNIFGVATPTVDSHAANKSYVDTTVANYQTTSGLATAVVTPIQNNAVYWDGTNFTAFKSGANKKIRGVDTPSDNSDAVPLGYFNTNALVKVGSEITASNAFISNLAMRSGASLADNDAVNYGYVRGLTLYGQAVTDPQTFTNAWTTAGTIVNGNKPYVFSLATLAATTGEMLVVTDSENRTYVPTTTVPAAAGQFFLLNTGVSPKTVTVYLTSGIAPSGTLTIRNFGTSRSVSAATAGAAVLGLVQVPTTSGLNVDVSGNITLNVGSSTQRGGYKVGTTLGLTSTDVLNVNLTTNINSTSDTTAASGSAVNALRLASMLIDGSIQMTGKLRTATATTAIASLSIPPSAATLGTLANGDLWNLNDVLQFRTTSATKQIAYRDAATTGALGLVQISTGNDSGLSITGPGVLSIAAATSTVLGGIKLGNGLALSSGSTVVNLSSLLNSTATDTAATSAAIKNVNDYAVATNAALVTATARVTTLESTTVPAVATTAAAALPKAGGEMAGMLQLVGSTSTRSALRFVGGSAPTTSLTAGDVWFESNILKMRIGTTTKDIAFTDSALTGTAATATKLANERGITLTGPVTGTVNFDGSQAVSIATTIATDAVALGTNTTGAYVATATGTDGVSVAGSGGESAGITISNTDKGSSQPIFKTITGGSTAITATTNTDGITIAAGTGISVTGNTATKTITITNTTTTPLTFGTIAVTGTAGQSPVVADTSAATLTLNAGTGMSITTNAGTDVITLANTGITSISGTGSQVNVSGGTTPTISLPQNIHSGASPTFAGATLGSVIIAAGAANTLTTGTNLDLILDPNGTGKISLQANVDCSSNTLNALGACTLGTVLSDAITMRTTGAKLKFGSAVNTTIEAMSTTSAGIYTIGDIVLRVPAAANKAFLITDPTAVPTAGTQLITKTALDTAVSSAISGGNLMPTAGTVHTAAQTLGCSVGSFTVQTGSTPADRLTITDLGAATFANGLTVTEGTTLSSTLVVTGTTTLNNSVTINSLYNVTSAKAPTTGNHLTNKTYVDAQDLAAPFNYELTLAKLNRDRKIDALVAASMGGTTVVTIDLSTIQIGVPTLVKCYTGGVSTSTGSVRLSIAAGQSAYLLSKTQSTSTNLTMTAAVPLSAPIAVTTTMYNVDVSNNGDPAATIAATPTLLNTVGFTTLATCTGGSNVRIVGFCILRVS